MGLEKIINILGKVTNNNLIIRRNSSQHSTFKGYTTYIIELYSIVKGEAVKVFSVEKTLPPLMKDHADEIMEEMFIEKLFETYVVK